MKTFLKIIVAITLIAAPAHAQFRSGSTNGTAIPIVSASYIVPGAYLVYNQSDTNIQMVVSSFFDLLNAQSGLLDDNNIASTIARDGEVTSAISALSSTYQPLDSDLTSIAALTTTSTGRSLLATADAAAIRAIASAQALATTLTSLSTNNASPLTNIQPSNISWSGLSTATFTNGIAARIAVYTNAGTIYYLTLSTNTP